MPFAISVALWERKIMHTKKKRRRKQIRKWIDPAWEMLWLYVSYLTPTTQTPHRTTLLRTIRNVDGLIILNAIAIVCGFRFGIIEAANTAHANATIACGRTWSPSTRAPFIIVSAATKRKHPGKNSTQNTDIFNRSFVRFSHLPVSRTQYWCWRCC